MSSIYNADGEPMLTAAELRFEAELDELSAWERWYDEDYYDPEED